MSVSQVGYNIFAGSCNYNKIINNNFDSGLYMWSSYDMQGMFNISGNNFTSSVFIKNTYELFSSLKDILNSYTYEDLQEKLVFKNRGDHRLQTVLNLFDRFSITEGSLEFLNLKVVSEFPHNTFSKSYAESKLENDRKRLIGIVQYAKTGDCRRDYLNNYFDAEPEDCNNCDNCLD